MKYFHRLFIITILSTAFVSDANAANSPKESLLALAQAIRENNPTTAGAYLTQASRELYQRFVSYNLFSCLPKDVSYLSQQPNGKAALVSASLTAPNGAKQIAKLTFTRENGGWKFDLPASLKRALGENWENRVNTVEQLYLFMKAQLGDQLDCATIQELAK